MPTDLPNLLSQRDCFLFDLDGTLVDSNACHEQAYRQALEHRLPEIARRFSYEPCKGRRTRDALSAFGVEDVALLDELTEAKQRAYRALVEGGAVPLLPNAHELLQVLRARRSRLFLVTGASARSTQSVLSRLGILDWFEQIVTADDVTQGKPAPDCWLTCLERAAIQASQSLVIEDALSGIQAARAAGVACIAIHNPELKELPEYAGELDDLLIAVRAGAVA